jgi:hypothetical protein
VRLAKQDGVLLGSECNEIGGVLTGAIPLQSQVQAGIVDLVAP